MQDRINLFPQAPVIDNKVSESSLKRALNNRII